MIVGLELSFCALMSVWAWRRLRVRWWRLVFDRLSTDCAIVVAGLVAVAVVLTLWSIWSRSAVLVLSVAVGLLAVFVVRGGLRRLAVRLARRWRLPRSLDRGLVGGALATWLLLWLFVTMLVVNLLTALVPDVMRDSWSGGALATTDVRHVVAPADDDAAVSGVTHLLRRPVAWWQRAVDEVGALSGISTVSRHVATVRRIADLSPERQLLLIHSDPALVGLIYDPAVQALACDPDVELLSARARRGSIPALWALVESPEVQALGSEAFRQRVAVVELDALRKRLDAFDERGWPQLIAIHHAESNVSEAEGAPGEASYLVATGPRADALTLSTEDGVLDALASTEILQVWAAPPRQQTIRLHGGAEAHGIRVLFRCDEVTIHEDRIRVSSSIAYPHTTTRSD